MSGVAEREDSVKVWMRKDAHSSRTGPNRPGGGLWLYRTNTLLEWVEATVSGRLDDD